MSWLTKSRDNWDWILGRAIGFVHLQENSHRNCCLYWTELHLRQLFQAFLKSVTFYITAVVLTSYWTTVLPSHFGFYEVKTKKNIKAVGCRAKQWALTHFYYYSCFQEFKICRSLEWITRCIGICIWKENNYQSKNQWLISGLKLKGRI